MKLLQLFCLACALASALSANTVVFGNISCSYPGSDIASCINEPSLGSDPINSVSGEGPIYDSFTSGAAAGQITDLQLILSGDDTSSGSFQVGLFADNSGTPGAEIGTSLATVDDSALSITPAIYDIALDASVDADTAYWIGLSDTTTDAYWSYDSDGSGIGVAGESWFNASGGPNSDALFGAYQMQVTEDTPDTPEPASIFLIVAGVSVLALFRRRTA